MLATGGPTRRTYRRRDSRPIVEAFAKGVMRSLTATKPFGAVTQSNSRNFLLRIAVRSPLEEHEKPDWPELPIARFAQGIPC
jgi:hypothetical protein